MAAKRIAAEENNVDGQEQCPGPHMKTVGPLRRQVDVPREEREKDHGDVGEVPVHVLEYQRQPAFAPVAQTARFTDRTRGRVSPERLVVRAAVVITGEAEEAGERQDQQRGRKRCECRPPRGLDPEPRMMKSGFVPW